MNEKKNRTETIFGIERVCGRANENELHADIVSPDTVLTFSIFIRFCFRLSSFDYIFHYNRHCIHAHTARTEQITPFIIQIQILLLVIVYRISVGAQHNPLCDRPMLTLFEPLSRVHISAHTIRRGERQDSVCSKWERMEGNYRK